MKFENQEIKINEYIELGYNILVVKKWFAEKTILRMKEVITYFGKETDKAISIVNEHNKILFWIPKSVIVKQIKNGNVDIRYFVGE